MAKRGRVDVGMQPLNGGAGAKRTKEMDSVQPGIGSKSKPCTKFFSTSGCPFGEGCHFLHYVPGGYNTAAQMLGKPPVPAPRNQMAPPPALPDGHPAPVVKSRICNKFNSPEGCKFGDKCHFAHGERELGKPITSSHESLMAPPPFPVGGRLPGRHELGPPADFGAPGSFGASATAKISVDASLAGAIIGKGGVNSKNICRVTGAKLSIRDHETDPNLRNIELEGTFDQIKHASAMVREHILNVSTAAPHPGSLGPTGGKSAPGNNYKTKLCENFGKGSCTFGDRCHFAHGASELRKGTAN